MSDTKAKRKTAEGEAAPAAAQQTSSEAPPEKRSKPEAAPSTASTEGAASTALFGAKSQLGASATNNFLKAWGTSSKPGKTSWSLSGGLGGGKIGGTGFGALAKKSGGDAASGSAGAASTTTGFGAKASGTTAFGTVAASQGTAFAAKPGDPERKSIFGNAVASSSKVLGRAAEATTKEAAALAKATEQSTGEENEHRALQVRAKLYGFEEGTWRERGVGMISLLDESEKDQSNSRLVMRVDMTKKLCLNAPLAHARNIANNSQKTLCMTLINTAAETQALTNYTIKASAAAVQELLDAIRKRVPADAFAAPKAAAAPSTSKAPAGDGATSAATTSAAQSGTGTPAGAATPATASSASTPVPQAAGDEQKQS